MITEAFIIFFYVLCVWYTMQEGEIFGKLGDWFSKNTPHQIHPALFECNICMTPWYGSALYWIFPWHKVDLPHASALMWPIVILVAMGFNIVINKLQQKEDDVTIENRIQAPAKDITINYGDEDKGGIMAENRIKELDAKRQETAVKDFSKLKKKKKN